MPRGREIRRKMLLAAAVLLAFSQAAHGELGRCRALGGGALYAVLDDGTRPLIYKLSSISPRWRLEPFGWHATALIECTECRSDSIVRGVADLGGGDRIAARPSYAPGQRYTPPFTPWFETPFREAHYVGLPIEVSVDRFKGWLALLAAGSKETITHDIVYVSATDGCAGLSLRIETSPSKTGKPIEAVNDLLASIRISSADAKDDELTFWIDDRKRCQQPVTMSFQAFRKAIDGLR